MNLYILVNENNEPMYFEVDAYTDCELSSACVSLLEGGQLTLNGGVWVTRNREIAESMVRGDYQSPCEYLSDVTHPIVPTDLKQVIIEHYHVKELSF